MGNETRRVGPHEIGFTVAVDVDGDVRYMEARLAPEPGDDGRWIVQITDPSDTDGGWTAELPLAVLDAVRHELEQEASRPRPDADAMRGLFAQQGGQS